MKLDILDLLLPGYILYSILWLLLLIGFGLFLYNLAKRHFRYSAAAFLCVTVIGIVIWVKWQPFSLSNDNSFSLSSEVKCTVASETVINQGKEDRLGIDDKMDADLAQELYALIQGLYLRRLNGRTNGETNYQFYCTLSAAGISESNNDLSYISVRIRGLYDETEEISLESCTGQIGIQVNHEKMGLTQLYWYDIEDVQVIITWLMDHDLITKIQKPNSSSSVFVR